MLAPVPRRVVLLDVMSTLVVDPFFAEVPAFFGMSLEALIAAKHPDAWVRFERDQIDEATMLASFFADGRSYDHAGLIATMVAGYRFIEGIPALLDELRAAQVEMHTLSNYPRWFARIEDKLRLSRWVRWTFVSCKTGLRKPDARAYTHAVTALGVAAAQAVFVDDRADNCQAAARAGLQTEHFRGAEALKAALRQRGWL